MLLSAITALASLGAARVVPAVTLTPPQIACDSPNGTATARGAGFAPGTAVVINVEVAPPKGVIAGRATIGDDGTFAVPLQLLGALDCPATPRRVAVEVKAADASGRFGPPVLASATLVVVGRSMPGLPNTGGGGARILAPWGDTALFAGSLALLGGVTIGYSRRRCTPGQR